VESKVVRTKGDDANEQRVIDDVRQHGWHVVGIEDDAEGPGFAFSIGLYHTLKHPEIIIFGLKDARTMMHVINAVGEEVRKKARFEDWHESDQVLDGYSCMFRTVPPDVFPDYLGFALWFYQSAVFPVLQCVWPDSQHRYPWQDDCHPEVRRRQPILQPRRDWPFCDGKNRAVFTTKYVLDRTHPVLYVSHDAGGDWQFLCGTTNRSADGRIVCLGSIVELDPSIGDLAALPGGWSAMRTSADSPWRRSRN
jgi:hypothetical protein